MSTVKESAARAFMHSCMSAASATMLAGIFFPSSTPYSALALRIDLTTALEVPM